MCARIARSLASADDRRNCRELTQSTIFVASPNLLGVLVPGTGVCTNDRYVPCRAFEMSSESITMSLKVITSIGNTQQTQLATRKRPQLLISIITTGIDIPVDP